MISGMTAEQEQRSRALWDELTSRCTIGPLPFVGTDSTSSEIVSLWNVEATGNDFEDTQRGLMYAELLIHRAKNWRGGGDPFQAIAEICMAIAKKGNPGAVELGFFSVALRCWQWRRV